MVNETTTGVAGKAGFASLPLRERWVSVGVILLRLAVGVTFVVSGGAKLVDPAGTMYKIEDYLAVMHLMGFASLSLFMSIALSLVEVVLGVNTLLGSYRKATPILLAVFMGVMTPLTLYLAIANPIRDCGCFGDAIVLTNWQTFWKNVALTVLVVLLLCYNRRVRSLLHRDVQSIAVLYVLFYGGVVAWIGCSQQPVLDFRPYKVGVDLRAALDEYGVAEREYDFVYERAGVRQTFSLDNLPTAESGWQFVERHERKVLPAGEEGGIDHFTIYDGDRQVTDEVLGHEGYVYMLFSPDIRTAEDDDVNKINGLYDYCVEHGYPFYAVTSSSPRAIDRWLEDTGGEYEFYFMDKTTIRTIARNNPYIVVLKDGVIYDKYTPSALPEDEDLTLNGVSLEPAAPGRYEIAPRLWLLVGGLVVPLLLLLATERLALFVVRRVRNYYRERRALRQKRRTAKEEQNE